MMEPHDLFEMEELRRQHAVLKDKLKEQTILNDDLLKKAMAKDLNKVRRKTLISGVCAILVGFYASFVFYRVLDTSLALAIYTFIVLLIVGMMDLYHARILPKGEDLSADPTSVEQRFIRFVWWKKLRIVVGMSLCAVLFTWLLLEIPDDEMRKELAPWFIGGIALGLALGYLKIIQTRQDIRGIRRDLAKLEKIKNNEDINDLNGEQ